ncbi:19041_t:CDS:2, partial [Racocetra fulgida]
MEVSSQESLSDQDNIEWVSTLIPTTPRSNNVNVKNHNYNQEYKIQLKVITFNKRTCIRMFSSGAGDMAFLVRGKTREISICLHNMKDEIVINVKEIEEFRIAKDRSIILKLNPNFDRTDPTNDHFSDLNCLCLKPEAFTKHGEIYEVEKFIKKLMNETGQLNKATFNNWTTYNPRNIKNDDSKEDHSKGTLQPNSTLKSSEVATVQQKE